MEEIKIKCPECKEEIIVTEEFFNVVKKMMTPPRVEWDECLIKLRAESPDWDD
jgi:hypothetical protein